VAGFYLLAKIVSYYADEITSRARSLTLLTLRFLF